MEREITAFIDAKVTTLGGQVVSIIHTDSGEPLLWWRDTEDYREAMEEWTPADLADDGEFDTTVCVTMSVEFDVDHGSLPTMYDPGDGPHAEPTSILVIGETAEWPAPYLYADVMRSTDIDDVLDMVRSEREAQAEDAYYARRDNY